MSGDEGEATSQDWLTSPEPYTDDTALEVTKSRERVAAMNMR